jgi:hypothetical protein
MPKSLAIRISRPLKSQRIYKIQKRHIQKLRGSGLLNSLASVTDLMKFSILRLSFYVIVRLLII